MAFFVQSNLGLTGVLGVVGPRVVGVVDSKVLAAFRGDGVLVAWVFGGDFLGTSL